jgi:hypothetical protein
MINNWTVRCIHALLALDAIKITEFNTRSEPSSLESLHKAMNMNDVATIYHNARSGT